MSAITVSNLERISASTLANMLTAGAAKSSPCSSTTATGFQEDEGGIAVVDVRDNDYIGGHIRNSLHFPSQSLDATMPTLLRKLANKDVVVFHCALSQQRGPSAALQYLRAKEALQTAAVGATTTGSGCGSGGYRSACGSSYTSGCGSSYRSACGSAYGSAYGSSCGSGGVGVNQGTTAAKTQKVYVLDRGFVGWQEMYGCDERLTEGYSKELWEGGY
ncbi:Rhodanese-like protein [Nemania sp. FL0916]|nr:Rhodanese-like protein [Nemania sp. FL0916]